MTVKTTAGPVQLRGLARRRLDGITLDYLFLAAMAVMANYHALNADAASSAS